MRRGVPMAGNFLQQENVVPVSYTHLDVYKRQVYGRPAGYPFLYLMSYIISCLSKLNVSEIFRDMRAS